eukprot:3455016-Heterocapsa_arctica.AAC.1
MCGAWSRCRSTCPRASTRIRVRAQLVSSLSPTSSWNEARSATLLAPARSWFAAMVTASLGA